jgi:DNA polymerase III delta prime subunit
MFDNLTSENLHHAHLLSGDRETISPNLRIFLEKSTGREIAGNPDISWWEGETFGIEEARDMRTAQFSAAVADGARRFFVICAYSFSHQAQNALLKTLEEPAAGAHFFIVAPSKDLFIATLLSRLVLLEERAPKMSEDIRKEALAFLNASPSKRLEIIKPLLAKTDDHDEKLKQKRDADLFMENMLRALEEKMLVRPDARRAISEILAVKKYVSEPAGNVRLIMEHLSVVL